MKTFTAKQAHKQLGLVLDDSQHEPVEISKNGRPYSVLMSKRMFENLNALQALEAEMAWERSFASPKSDLVLDSLVAEVEADITDGKVFDYDPATQALVK